MIPVAQLSQLEAAAFAAVGRKESRCQFAMADLYKEVGLLPSDLAIPERARDAARWSNTSFIREWLEGAGAEYFAEVAKPAIAGDLLLFRLGHVDHHVAMMLGGGRFVHVFGEHGVQIADCMPTPWAKRLSSVWRIR